MNRNAVIYCNEVYALADEEEEDRRDRAWRHRGFAPRTVTRNDLSASGAYSGAVTAAAASAGHTGVMHGAELTRCFRERVRR